MYIYIYIYICVCTLDKMFLEVGHPTTWPKSASETFKEVYSQIEMLELTCSDIGANSLNLARERARFTNIVNPNRL